MKSWALGEGQKVFRLALDTDEVAPFSRTLRPLGQPGANWRLQAPVKKKKLVLLAQNEYQTLT
jgi:hypothetical protein